MVEAFPASLRPCCAEDVSVQTAQLCPNQEVQGLHREHSASTAVTMVAAQRCFPTSLLLGTRKGSQKQRPQQQERHTSVGSRHSSAPFPLFPQIAAFWTEMWYRGWLRHNLMPREQRGQGAEEYHLPGTAWRGHGGGWSKRTHRDQDTYLLSLFRNNPEFLPGIQDSIFITGEKTGMWGQSSYLWGSGTLTEPGGVGSSTPSPTLPGRGCSSVQTVRVAQRYFCTFPFLTSGCCRVQMLIQGSTSRSRASPFPEQSTTSSLFKLRHNRKERWVTYPESKGAHLPRGLRVSAAPAVPRSLQALP